MKRILRFVFIQLLFITLITDNGISQTENFPYSWYYKYISKAEVYKTRNNLDSAFCYYKKAFVVEKATPYDLYKATDIAVKLDSINCLTKYIRQLILFGNDSSYLCSKYLSKLTSEKLNEVKLYVFSDYDSLHNTYLKNINQPLRDTLLKMAKDDQYYRISKHGLNDSLWGIELKKTDIRIFNHLTQIVKQYGWPNYKKVGIAAAGAFNIMLLHGARRFAIDSEEWLFFEKIMKEEVQNGNVSPITFGQWIDQHLTLVEKKPQRYGTSWDLQNKLDPIEDIENVDKRRAEVGLGSLEDFMITHGLSK